MNDDLYTKLDGEVELHLTSAEREHIRAQLYRYMQEFPLRYTATVSPYTFAFMRSVLPALAVVLLLVVSSGTAFAAQGSLPGDILYPVKISLNEQIQSALAFSPTAKAEVHASLAERRLEEAQTLAAKGELTTENTKLIQANFKEHAAVAKLLAHEVGKTDPAKETQLTTQLASTVVVNGAVLESIGSKSQDNDTKEDAKVLALEVHTVVASDESVEATTSIVAVVAPSDMPDTASTTAHPAIAMQTQPVRKMSATQQKNAVQQASSSVQAKEVQLLGEQLQQSIDNSNSQLKSMNETLDASTTLQLKAKLDSIFQMKAAGDAAYKDGLYDQSFALYTQSYAASARFQIILKALQKFKPSMVMPIFNLRLDTGEVLGTTTDMQLDSTSTTKTSVTNISPTTTKKNLLEDAGKKASSATLLPDSH